LSIRPDKVRAFGQASLGAWKRHRARGDFAPEIRCHHFCIRRPGIASAPRGKSLGNMGGAEISLRQQTIVDGAEQAKILRYRGPAARPRLLVVDLKKRAR
jgi:hypothetical protein